MASGYSIGHYSSKWSLWPYINGDVSVRVSLHPDSAHDTPNQNAGVPVGGGPAFPRVSTEDSDSAEPNLPCSGFRNLYQ